MLLKIYFGFNARISYNLYAEESENQFGMGLLEPDDIVDEDSIAYFNRLDEVDEEG